MSRRDRKKQTAWGRGKHRKARMQRFNAKHPAFKKKIKLRRRELAEGTHEEAAHEL